MGNGARNAAKTGGPLENAFLESRYKLLILLIVSTADSAFWYKYTFGGGGLRAKKRACREFAWCVAANFSMSALRRLC